MTEWKKRKLGDLLDIKHGYAFSGNNISSELTRKILITPGNFNIGGGFKSNKFKYYKGEAPEEYKKIGCRPLSSVLIIKKNI